jgi:hypothetical protein
MPIASLKILSPNTIAYRLGSASNSLKMANTLTGSVADISDPKANDSFRVKSGMKESGVPLVKPQNTKEVENMAMKVPKKEYINTVPMFLKKGLYCKL